MTPLRERIPATLRLQPMTKRELARCLSCSYRGVEHALSDHRLRSRVRIVGTVRHGQTRRDWLWGLA